MVKVIPSEEFTAGLILFIHIHVLFKLLTNHPGL
jgi:hypothetical protein